jgi:hypothetical protein
MNGVINEDCINDEHISSAEMTVVIDHRRAWRCSLCYGLGRSDVQHMVRIGRAPELVPLARTSDGKFGLKTWCASAWLRSGHTYPTKPQARHRTKKLYAQVRFTLTICHDLGRRRPRDWKGWKGRTSPASTFAAMASAASHLTDHKLVRNHMSGRFLPGCSVLLQRTTTTR